jgi:hypothetical protein
MVAEEPTVESLRRFLTSAGQKMDDMKRRLQLNDARLISLETGVSSSQKSWTETTASADRIIAAVTATEIGVRAFGTSGLDGEFVGQPLIAMPGFTSENLEEIAQRGESARFGAINMMQGYLGEERALNAINSGAVPVPEGRYATLAESSNQPGYDLMLLSENGAAPIVAQVKISDSAGIIREHFSRYPEVGIVYTNSEAAQALVGDPSITVLRASDHFPDAPGHYVVDMGFTKDEIRAGAVEIMDGSDGVSFGDQIQENIPWIALIAIAGRAAYEYLDTDTNSSEIVKAAIKRIKQTTMATGASTLTTAATTEPLIGTVAGVTTLFGGRAVGQAREDVRYAADRLSRMGAVLRRIHAQQTSRSSLSI